MNRRIKRRIAIATTAIAVVGIAGGAYAATQNSGATQRKAFLGDVAKRLNVTPGQLNAAIDGALGDRLAAAVKAGKLTQAQANAIEQRVHRHGYPFPLLGGRRVGLAAPRVAAKYLGLTVTQLRQERRSGKSLAQIATSRGKSVSGLEQAIVTADRAKIEKAYAKHRLTQAQEQRLLNALPSRVAAQVNRAGMPSRPRVRSGDRAGAGLGGL